MAYYKRIKELREDNDKTQNEIAKYLGMKQPQYCRYENGLRDIPSDILVVCRASKPGKAISTAAPMYSCVFQLTRVISTPNTDAP